jgi:O-methyltransferase involved in polyketide biosynthesis
VKLGYYTDDFVRFFDSTEGVKRPPLINRGYWTRVAKYRDVLTRFLEQGHEHCNIVSIGAGLDTNYWHFRGLYTNFKYVEVDFLEVNQRKLEIVVRHPELELSEVTTAPTHIDAGNYAMINGDLRNPDPIFELLSQLINTSEPTLFLTECVLIYLDPE